MALLTIEQRVFIIKTFYQNNGSLIIVQRAFGKEYGRKEVPANSTISR